MGLVAVPVASMIPFEHITVKRYHLDRFVVAPPLILEGAGSQTSAESGSADRARILVFRGLISLWSMKARRSECFMINIRCPQCPLSHPDYSMYQCQALRLTKHSVYT